MAARSAARRPGAGRTRRAGVGTIDSWLVWNLSGGRRHVTDASNASRTLLYDIHARRWDDELLALLDVPRALLPEVCASSGVLGTTDPRLTLGVALPIAGLAGDQQAALFRQAATRRAWPEHLRHRLLPADAHRRAGGAFTPRLLTTIAWQIGDQLEYALEGSIFVAGSAVQWLRDGLKLIDTAADSEALAQSVASTGGGLLRAGLRRLGAPYWERTTRGALFGLDARQRPGRDLPRRARSDRLPDPRRARCDAGRCGLALERLRVDGGAVANAFLMQFQSDISACRSNARPSPKPRPSAPRRSPGWRPASGPIAPPSPPAPAGPIVALNRRCWLPG